MSKEEIDLKKLSVWIQYTIALSVTAIIVTVGWFVGRNQPVPTWLTTYLIPVLGWLYIVLLSYVIISRLFMKKK